MTASGDFIKAFDEMFENIETVSDQVNVVQTTYDALLDTVEEYGDAHADDLNSVSELLVACIGATSACLRVLKLHLEQGLAGLDDSNPRGLG